MYDTNVQAAIIPSVEWFPWWWPSTG